MHLRFPYLLLPIFAVFTFALPEPSTQFQHQNPHQVGFVIPPAQSPPYGKALPASTYSYPSRQWNWKHWLVDAKSAFKSLLGKPVRPSRPKQKPDEDERNVGRFDNDIVLRVNVTSFTDRITIAELAEVLPLRVG